MGKITAIDLGSNTFRAALFDCEKKDIISSYEKTVRTAQGLRKSGRISQEALGRIIDAALMMPPHFYAHPVRAVTTQALRKAANAKAVLKEIKKHTGIDFCVISGEKEASLTLDAVQNRLEKLSFGTQSLLLADIGGGSTEIIIAKNGRSRIHSFEIGIVGIAEYGIGAYEQEFDALKRFVGTKDFSAFVCTAGTPTTVAALKKGLDYANYDASAVNGTIITPQDLNSCQNLLASSSQSQKEQLVGTGRDDLIAAGIMILRRLFAIVDKADAVVIDDGLREGAALQLCENNDK